MISFRNVIGMDPLRLPSSSWEGKISVCPLHSKMQNASNFIHFLVKVVKVFCRNLQGAQRLPTWRKELDVTLIRSCWMRLLVHPRRRALSQLRPRWTSWSRWRWSSERHRKCTSSFWRWWTVSKWTCMKLLEYRNPESLLTLWKGWCSGGSSSGGGTLPTLRPSAGSFQ